MCLPWLNLLGSERVPGQPKTNMSLHTSTTPRYYFQTQSTITASSRPNPHLSLWWLFTTGRTKNTCLQNLTEHSSTIRFLSLLWFLRCSPRCITGTLSERGNSCQASFYTYPLLQGLNPVSGTSIPFPNTLSKGSFLKACSLSSYPWWNPTYQSQETNILCNTVGPHHPRQI